MRILDLEKIFETLKNQNFVTFQKLEHFFWIQLNVPIGIHNYSITEWPKNGQNRDLRVGTVRN